MNHNPFSNPAAAMRIVVVLWTVALAGIFIRIAIAHQHSVYPIYEHGATEWMHGRPVYEQNARTPNGFVYSPLAAAFFVPLALLPQTAGEILWRLLGVAVCMLAIRRWLDTTGRRFLDARLHPLFYLLLLPLFLGNLNNGQANILLIGLLLWAMVAADAGAWMVSALCIAIATYLKVYPLAVGFLMAAIYPRKFTWRLFAALAGLGVLSLFLQHPGYVAGQYKLWISTRLSENRHQFDQESVPHDLFMLLTFLHCHLGEGAYKVVKALTGGFIAVLCLRGRFCKWPEDRLLNHLLALSCTWLLFCGPSSESSTYVLMAPSVMLELLHCFSQPVALWRRVWMGVVFALYLGSFTIRSLTPLRDPRWMVSQPASAFLFYCYLVVRTWQAGDDAAREEEALDRRAPGTIIPGDGYVNLAVEGVR